MGKRDKKQRHPQRNSHRAAFHYTEEEEGGVSYEGHAASKFSLSEGEEEVGKKDEEEEDEEEEVEIEGNEENDEYPSKDMPSKFLLYQQSVQV